LSKFHKVNKKGHIGSGHYADTSSHYGDGGYGGSSSSSSGGSGGKYHHKKGGKKGLGKKHHKYVYVGTYYDRPELKPHIAKFKVSNQSLSLMKRN
jgi:hypothetical protein